MVPEPVETSPSALESAKCDRTVSCKSRDITPGRSSETGVLIDISVLTDKI
jgi:hypothetical protein